MPSVPSFEPDHRGSEAQFGFSVNRINPCNPKPQILATINLKISQARRRSGAGLDVAGLML